MKIKEFTDSINDFISKAVDLGKQVTSNEICLSTDIKKIDELDAVINAVKNLYRKHLIDDTVAWNISVTLGTVLGEMIIGEHGFHWAINSESIPVVETDEKNQMSPITKIYKILLDTEECEGTARGFYDGFLALQKYDSMTEEEKRKMTEYIN